MNRETLIQARRLLVELYDDPITIRRVIADAGLNSARINLGGSAINMWHAVLDEAQKSGLVGALGQVAIDDYPNREHQLRQLFDLQQGSTGPATSAPETQATTDSPAIPAQPAPTTASAAAPTFANAREIEIDMPRTIRLKAIERQLLSTRFAQAAKLKLMSEFTDGRTATRVFLVRPTDAQGMLELPAVVKIGPLALIAEEWQATQTHVLRRLSGFAAVQGEPIYLQDADGARWGALRYTQVGDSIFPVESLANYSANASLANLWHVLQNRLLRQLREFWQASQTWEPFTFRDSYDAILPVNLIVAPFSQTTAPPATVVLDGAEPGTMAAATRLQPGVIVQIKNFVIEEVSTDGNIITLDLPRGTFRLRLQWENVDSQARIGRVYPSIIGTVTTTRTDQLQQFAKSQLKQEIDLAAATVSLPDQRSEPLPNPLLALPDLLARQSEGWFATIHGDLNLRNILVDPDARTTAIIDCASARRDHVLHDLLRMERDIVTDLLTQIFFQNGLPATAIVHFYRCLHCALRGPSQENGQFSLPKELNPALHKSFIMLATLRGVAREFLGDANQWQDYYTGLIIHLVGALKFRDLDTPTAGHEPKALAFWGAAALLDLLRKVEAGADQGCRDLTWSPFNVLSDDATMQDPALESMGPDIGGELGTKSPVFATPSDVTPAQRRLDVAAPEKAQLHRAFSLAVAVRQLGSPPLELTELPEVHSGNAQLDWPEDAPYVRVRVQVIAPECEINGEDTHSIKLYRNLDSELFLFSLTPKVTGRLNIIVRLYQEEDMLGSTLLYTTVSEQVVSEVKVQLRSEPVDVKDEAGGEATTGRGGLAPVQKKIKILFLTANPLDTVWLRTGDEARAIDQALRQAEHRIFEFAVHQAVRIDDLQDLLLRHRPDIVHFSGHGTAANELIFQDHNGNAVPVRGSALRALFNILKDNIRCVVLNACYTAEQAGGVAEVIDCVVGISDAISDDASLQFATAFYRGLGYGRSVKEAFALGQVQIELAGLGEAAELHLLERVAGAAGYSFTT